MSLCPPTLSTLLFISLSRKTGPPAWRMMKKMRYSRPFQNRWVVVLAGLWVLGSATYAAEPIQQPPAGDEIPLTVGRSVVLDHPDEIRRVAIANDAVADAIVISTREMLINGKSPGLTSMVIWSRSGDRNFFTLNVKMNVEQLQEHIRTSFPGEQIRLSAGNGVVTLMGKASNAQVMERIVAMVSGLGATIINNVEIPPPPAARQIMLKVKFAEVDRQAQQDFGVSILSTGSANTLASIATQQFGSARLQNLQGGIPASIQQSFEFQLQDIFTRIPTLVSILLTIGWPRTPLFMRV